MKNALTVDVEDWFHICDIPGDYDDVERWDTFPSRVVENTRRLLEIFDEAGVRGTFFFLGWVAERFPELVREVKEAGHEIASHGYAHKLIYEVGEEGMREELTRGLEALRAAGADEVVGFRGAGFSLKKGEGWFYNLLAELGFKYDSTVFPARRGHGGWEDAPTRPFKVETEKGVVWEFPISVVELMGKRVPFSGGGYLRIMPAPILRRCFRQLNEKGIPCVLYIHPREIDPDHPRLPMPLLRRFKSYVNIKGTEGKLRMLLSEFEFAPMREVLDV